MRAYIVGVASLWFVSTIAAQAFAAEPAFTSPKKAGRDFAVQGEYSGQIKMNGEEKSVGVQVMALGNHGFDATLFYGGLPGDGWLRGDKQEKAHGKTEEGKTEFDGKSWKATIEKHKMTISDESGQKLGEIIKNHRKSPTLNAVPPEGAVVLFDGTNTDAWTNGKIIEGKLLDIDPTSKQSFKDFTLHIEFRCPYMPDARGQARGNSGVFLQNRYEIQVLDSFGAVGDVGDCGAFYSIAPERVNMSFPPLSWQTYDIDFTAARCDKDGKKVRDARLTVRHNGVLVHDNFDIVRKTPGGIENESADPGQTVVSGPFWLQNHGGDPVAFRNIWVVEKK
jgi:hypothetical protein